MTIETFVHILQKGLSKDSKVLTDPSSSDFKATIERWSDLSLKVPGAIVKPANEEDVIHTVREAFKSSTPFAIATGGHSPWSTIQGEGFVLDLSLYKAVIPDPTTRSVTIKGGVLMKELQAALSTKGQFTSVSNGSTVGCIPFFINGGINTYYPLIGFACENILSAKVVMANGQVYTASDKAYRNLMWAIRGAGQFLGVVLELTVKTYPNSLLGNPDGSRQLGTYMFLPHQITDVCRVMSKIIADTSHVSAGQIMITAAPPDLKQQIILVTTQTFGSEKQASTAFQSLVELGPKKVMQTTSDFEHHSDHLDWTCAHGDFKRYSQIGLEKFQPANFIKLVDLHSKLLAECPGAGKSAMTFQWHSQRQKPAAVIETAFGNQDVNLWFNVLGWYTGPSQHEKMARFDRDAQAQMRIGTKQSDFVSYTNTSREDPIEYRYKGEERLEKLQELKLEWDPTGVFTKELLDVDGEL